MRRLASYFQQSSIGNHSSDYPAEGGLIGAMDGHDGAHQIALTSGAGLIRDCGQYRFDEMGVILSRSADVVASGGFHQMRDPSPHFWLGSKPRYCLVFWHHGSRLKLRDWEFHSPKYEPVRHKYNNFLTYQVFITFQNPVKTDFW